MVTGYTDRHGKPIPGWSRQCYQSPGQPTAPHLQMGRRRGICAARRHTHCATLAPLQAGLRPLAGNAARAARRRPPRRGHAAPLARGRGPHGARAAAHRLPPGRTMRHAPLRDRPHRRSLRSTARRRTRRCTTAKSALVFIGPQGVKAQSLLAPCLLRDPQSYCFSPVDSERKRKDAMREARKTPVPAVAARPPQATPKASAQGPLRYERPTPAPCAAHATRRTQQAHMDRPSRFRPTSVSCPAGRTNQLRHAAATEIRKRHDGLEAAQVVLGHSKADVTQIYAERDHKLASRIIQGDRLDLTQSGYASRTTANKLDRLQGFITCSQRRSGWPGTLIDRSERYSCCSSSAISLNNAPEDLQLIQYDTADFASLPALDRTSNEPLGTLVQETHIAAFHASCEQHAICTLYQIRKLLFGPLHNGIAEFLGCPRHSARSKS